MHAVKLPHNIFHGIIFRKIAPKVFTNVNFTNVKSLRLLLVMPKCLAEVNFVSLPKICQKFQPRNITCYIRYVFTIILCLHIVPFTNKGLQSALAWCKRGLRNPYVYVWMQQNTHGLKSWLTADVWTVECISQTQLTLSCAGSWNEAPWASR